jgi:hypothetical protein
LGFFIVSFLAPFFLLGTVAIVGPFIFHLIRRTTRERQAFSSLMFLMPSPPRLTRRSRLEHLLLLALRCLVICLLAAAFARPFIRKPMAPDLPDNTSKTVLVLVDTSASMRRGNLWSQAKDKVQSLLRGATLADRVAVYSFDRQLTQIFGFEQWSATSTGERAGLAAAKVSTMSPGWFETRLGNALIGAAEILEDRSLKAAPGRRQIVVISDLQEGSHVEPLQGYEWPKGIEVSVEALKIRDAGNAVLQLIPDSEEISTRAAAGVRVRVANAPDSKRDQFTIGWADDPGVAAATPVQVYVPAGQSRSIVLPISTGASANRLVLRGDDEEFDNTAFVIPPAQTRVTLAYLGNDSGEDPQQPLYFLKRAFPETHKELVEIKTRQDIPDLSIANLIVAGDAMAEQEARKVHDVAAAGKTVLFVLRDQSSTADLARVLETDNIRSEEAKVNNYAILGEIDFGHPLFAPFVDARFSDFSKIHFWRYRKLDPTAIPGAHVLARFDIGDPALIQVPVGHGQVFVLTSGWQPGDSQLALSTKFVPLLFAILEQAGGVAPPPPQYYVGDTVPLAQFGSVSQVRLPDGSELNMAAGETNFSRTVMPGIYELATSAGTGRFAVNLDPTESRTMPMAGDELETLGAPVAALAKPEITRAGKVDLQFAELENRQKLWRWVIGAVILLLFGETWLAGRTTRELAQVAPEPVAS